MKLSIIVPVYNVEKYLKDCLRSIHMQTFQDYELILVDDGSKDRSSIICDRYAQKERRVRVIHSPNRGVSHARNIGIEAARGEYILFIDADDVLSGKDVLHDVMRLTDDPAVDMIATRNDEFYGTSIKHLQKTTNQYHEAGRGEVRRFVSVPLVTTNLFSRRAIGDIRFDPRITLGEDTLFLIKAISNSGKIIIYDRVSYLRRIRPESASHKDYKPGDIEESGLLYRLLYKELHGKSAGDELFEKYYADQTGAINRLMDKHKYYRKEVRIVRERVRSVFPHFLGNRLMTVQTKVFLVMFMVNPDLFYMVFRPYKMIKGRRCG